MLTISLLLQVSPGPAQDPAVETSARPQGGIEFTEDEYEDSREGYLELSWNEIEDAAEYVVFEENGNVHYRGWLPKAFISGLSDGDFAFFVRAVDEQGNVLATSKQPANVVVRHWPLKLALGLFAVGSVIFALLISVIARGAFSTRATVTSTQTAAKEA